MKEGLRARFFWPEISRGFGGRAPKSTSAKKTARGDEPPAPQSRPAPRDQGRAATVCDQCSIFATVSPKAEGVGTMVTPELLRISTFS
ncbi:hypothetical protein SAMN05443432_102256 [Roseovarius litoreus]|uniref:Uncharacterized protein n=1 Tax=Roseovarius litoreus TaxID=1155722 RepID=A0A1M7CQE5_9RHOB|nr:hypothetical protein SAMN05443432_102256 [Roseovarius litoreus]